MTLIRGPSEEQEESWGGGAVGWAMQDQSGRFVYDATTNGVQ